MIVPCCYVINRISTALPRASVLGFCDAFALSVLDHSSLKLIGGAFRELTQELADDVAADIISVAPSVALPNWASRLHGCVKAAVS